MVGGPDSSADAASSAAARGRLLQQSQAAGMPPRRPWPHELTMDTRYLILGEAGQCETV